MATRCELGELPRDEVSELLGEDRARLAPEFSLGGVRVPPAVVAALAVDLGLPSEEARLVLEGCRRRRRPEPGADE
jgi:hypothetical protein